MGLYLNPNADAFLQNKNSRIYVDKSMILDELNQILCTNEDFVCMSRARRFGKSMAGNLISAYYSRGCDTRDVFSGMKIGQLPDFDRYLNKFNVIKLDLNGFFQTAVTKELLMEEINETVRKEFRVQFPDLEFSDTDNIGKCMLQVYDATGEKFVIIIDEYDVLVREKVSSKLFDSYLGFLNGLFKNTTLRPAIALAYITGILPIVRDKIQSKLNEFTEYTMLNPDQFAGHIGFTHNEVVELCDQYGMNVDECARWYDGYDFSGTRVYNPLSVVTSMRKHKFGNYWSTTGSYDALKEYILMNFDGIQDDVVKMIAGESVEVDVTSYLNTMNDFRCKDDVFTYLIHLGYLSYDIESQSCKIPNEEVRQEWVKSIKVSSGYKELMDIINTSKKLLDDTINGNEQAVAQALNDAHTAVTSNLTYNDEHCFQSAICLAYFYANTRYTLVKELPTGKGYADLVLIPYLPNIPALVIELKHNKSAASALAQIKAKNYCEAFTHYQGDLLFVGISYDEKTKEHECRIEKV